MKPFVAAQDSFVAKRLSADSPGLNFGKESKRLDHVQREGAGMLNILIVEDEPLFASTLRHLIELNPL